MANPIYYNDNQILTGLYTAGNELTDDAGKDYIGPYHRYPNDTFWSEFNPGLTSRQLFRKNKIVPDNNLTQLFKKTLVKKISNYIEPIPYYPIINKYDIETGFMERYFLESTNPNDLRIIEIDLGQYLSLNYINVEGIDATRYVGGFLIWYLNKHTASIKNQREIEILSKRIPGINLYLQNIFEFTR